MRLRWFWVLMPVVLGTILALILFLTDFDNSLLYVQADLGSILFGLGIVYIVGAMFLEWSFMFNSFGKYGLVLIRAGWLEQMEAATRRAAEFGTGPQSLMYYNLGCGYALKGKYTVDKIKKRSKRIFLEF